VRHVVEATHQGDPLGAHPRGGHNRHPILRRRRADPTSTRQDPAPASKTDQASQTAPTAHSDNCLGPEHADHVSNNPETPATRRDQIGRRIDAIGTRIEELEEQRQAGPGRGAGSDRLAAAQRHAARSQAAAEQAITSSINALRRAAEAHDSLAAAYERLAAAGGR
jgi:hypothetical protein